jgi:hypothetical protein
MPLSAQSMDELFEEGDETVQDDGDQEGSSEGDASSDGNDETDGAGEGSGAEDQDGATEDADGDGGSQESEGGVDLESLTTSPARFSGSVSSNAGISLGFEEWPGTDAAAGRDPDELFRASGLYDMSATLKVDARPHPKIRFLTRVKSELAEEQMRFSGLSISELFVDYTLGQNLFLRAGKQNLTWGEGRLLSNPANLVDRLSDGVGLRASYPLGGGTINGVVYSISSWVSDFRPGSPRAFGYAALYETTLAGVTGQLSTHYKFDERTESAASLSFGLGPVDLTLEGVTWWQIEKPLGGASDAAAIGQLFWEPGGWSFLAEYEFDTAVSNWEGHYAGLGVQAPSVWGGWNPRLRWRHAFQDNSGEVIPALSGTVAPKLTASFSTPVVYGQPGSFYREAEDDADDDLSGAVPVDDVVSVLLGVSLRFSF